MWNQSIVAGEPSGGRPTTIAWGEPEFAEPPVHAQFSLFNISVFNPK